jgi:hypothetical protein
MFMLNNNPLPVGRAFTANGIQYPSNWLRLASAAEKAAIGITEVADPVRADDRFYWNGDVNLPKELNDREEVDAEGNPMWVQVLDNSDPANPVMVDSDERLVTKGLKSQWIAQVKDTAGKMLAATDWMVIRQVERSVAVPAATATYRAAVLTEAARLEAAIAGAADIDAFIAVVQDQRWPEA